MRRQLWTVLTRATLLIVLHFLAIQYAVAGEIGSSQLQALLTEADELKEQGYYLKAIPLAENALRFLRADVGDKKAEVAKCLNRLGELNYLAGKYERAEQLLKESLSINKSIHGPDHVDTAETYHHFGVLKSLTRQVMDAETSLSKAIQLKIQSYGDNHPSVARTMVDLGRLYSFTGNFLEASALLGKALEIQEKEFGSRHKDLIVTLNGLGWLNLFMNQLEESESFCTRALNLGEEIYGQEHLLVAESLNCIGRIQYERNENEKSIETNKRSLAIREKFLLSDHPCVGWSLNDLALPYMAIGDLETARSLLLKSLSIMEKTFGKDSIQLHTTLMTIAKIDKALFDLDSALNYAIWALEIAEKNYPEGYVTAESKRNLAEIYELNEEWEKVESMLLEALNIYEKILASDHQKIALSLNGLGRFYYAQGNFTKAVQYYERCLEILEKAKEVNPVNYINSLNNLGLLHQEMGDYDKAELFYRQSLENIERFIGADSTSMAAVSYNMGYLYYLISDYENSLDLYQRSRKIYEDNYGPDHELVGKVWDKQGMLYETLGLFDKAEPCYLRALEISENTFGPKHPSVSRIQNNLATLYFNLKDYENAEKLFFKVLENKEMSTGVETISYANTLNNLAALYYEQKSFEKASELYDKAINIWIKNLGTNHPLVANGFFSLAKVYTHNQKIKDAYDLLVKGLEINKKTNDQVMGFTSESQKQDFKNETLSEIYRLLSLVNQFYQNDPIKKKQAMDVWISWKGIVLESQQTNLENIFQAADTESLELFSQLGKVRGKLSNMVFSSNAGGDEYQVEVDRMVEEINRLEARISRVSKKFAIARKITNARCQNIAGLLPNHAVLVDIARVGKIDFGKSKPEEGKEYYLAFILHKGDGNRVAMIDLGDADKIDCMIASLKKEIAESGGRQSDVAVVSKQLYDLVFQPLRKELGGARVIFISPDGNLNLLPFEVLQGPENKFLIEDFTFNYLAAGRDIVGFRDQRDSTGACLLIGDPDFDFAPEGTEKVAKETKASRRSVNLGEVTFTQLIHAGDELNTISEIIGRDKSKVFAGRQASENVLTENPGPELLHLATHGFFLGDRNYNQSGRGWTTAALSMENEASSSRIDRQIDIQNPMLRSGILLAGAKRSLLSGASGAGDGIVTAEKILGLNLRGTRMVVLSACDTGLGEVKSGEGVYGLRRAFAQAGAESLVMSLWKVPDLETKEMMVQFYTNIKSGSMNRCQALRQAALKQKEIVKERYGHESPRYWGAFVFLGQP